MFLNEFEAEVRKVVRAVAVGDRSVERAVEIIDHLVDEFSARFDSRSDIVRFTRSLVARLPYPCVVELSAAIADRDGGEA